MFLAGDERHSGRRASGAQRVSRFDSRYFLLSHDSSPFEERLIRRSSFRSISLMTSTSVVEL